MSGVVESADYPYTSGSAPDATTPVSAELNLEMPATLRGTVPDFPSVSIPNASSSERINYLVEPGARVQRLKAGGSSETFKVTPADGGKPRVLKLRSVYDDDIDGAARWYARDTATEGVLRQVAPEARYNGEPFIRVAENLGTSAERQVGAVWQEYVEGPTAFQLKNAVDVARGTRAVRGMAADRARNILQEAGLTIDEADSRIRALELFYARAHNDVIHFQRESGLTVLWNQRNTGIMYDVRQVGFDYNHGGNVMWVPSERKFVIFDW